MFGKDVLSFWCAVVDREPIDPFQMSLHRDSNIYALKKAIKEEIALHDIDPTDIPTVAERLNPEDTLGERIRLRGDLTTFAKKLPASQKVSTLPPQDPLDEHLHILVQLRSAGPTEVSRLFEQAEASSLVLRASPRQDTVAALYERLKQYDFIQVRGTPGSGKTTLAILLQHYISQQDPNVRVIRLQGWPDDVKDYDIYLKEQGWLQHKQTVFIFDEAQDTYRDSDLWIRFFKSIRIYRCSAIIFASYGSPISHMSIARSPMVIPDSQRVTLSHITHEDGLRPAGLLFTRSEFNDLVNTHYLQFCFDSSFFDAVFGVTNGHIGAIVDFIQIVAADDSYRTHKHKGQLYTWKSFLAAFSPRKWLRRFEDSDVFRKGLPRDEELRGPATASVFSAVLCGNVVMDDEFETVDEERALQECFRQGWLHSDKLVVANGVEVEYFFPSFLHRWYMEWKLLDRFPPPSFRANSLLDFVIGVIRRFSPRLLSVERRIGPGCIQRPPEALYQDELYRCCHALSKGSLVTFPEFGMAEGRADFYIPAKEWGIELLHDGNQLASHHGRFSKQESYATSLPISDYIIVDCRATRPIKGHPDMPKLYHVVFEDNFESVCILDSRLSVVSGFRLLAP